MTGRQPSERVDRTMMWGAHDRGRGDETRSSHSTIGLHDSTNANRPTD